MIETILSLSGGLALFLYGMKIMSEGLQAATGERLKNILWKSTSNRVRGVLTGFTITAIIQSSSAATVMIVSFVSAGLIDLMQASGIVLGANIGTTVTGWIVAVIGFNFRIAVVALTIIAAGFFIRFFKSDKSSGWGDFILGLGILLFSLVIMNDQIIELKKSDALLNFLTSWRADGMPSIFLLVIAGTIAAMLVQSSSAAMAVTMIFTINGLIDFPTAAALILGENMGTTITANIAAIRSTVEAKKAARVHFLFNFFGIIWMLIIFKPLFIPFIDWLIPAGNIPGSSVSASATIAVYIAAFHTGFNICNVILFLPFLKHLAKAAEYLVSGDDNSSKNHLMFITTNVISTPSININQARLEIQHMAGIVIDMYDDLIHVMVSPDKKLTNVIEQILLREEEIDHLEKEIATFLVKVSRDPLSKNQSNEISSILNKVSELENIGDQCESILKLLRKKYEMKISFSENGTQEILETSNRVKDFLKLISLYITSTDTDIMTQADKLESRIDELKRDLRNRHIQRLNDNQCEVDQGIIFIDIVSALEKIGDHCHNIAETISGKRIF